MVSFRDYVDYLLVSLENFCSWLSHWRRIMTTFASASILIESRSIDPAGIVLCCDSEAAHCFPDSVIHEVILTACTIMTNRNITLTMDWVDWAFLHLFLVLLTNKISNFEFLVVPDSSIHQQDNSEFRVICPHNYLHKLPFCFSFPAFLAAHSTEPTQAQIFITVCGQWRGRLVQMVYTCWVPLWI